MFLNYIDYAEKAPSDEGAVAALAVTGGETTPQSKIK